MVVPAINKKKKTPVKKPVRKRAKKKYPKKRITNPNERLDIGLTEEQQLEAVDQVLYEFELDKGARAAWESDQNDILEDWLLVQDTKDEPWENCSNVSVPITTVTVNQFHARGYDAFFGSKEMVSCRPTPSALKDIMAEVSKEVARAITMQKEAAAKEGKEPPPIDPVEIRNTILAETHKRAEEAKSAVERYMSTELTENMPEYESNQDVMLLSLGLFGTAFKKEVWDKKEERVKSVFVPATKLYIPYMDDREIASHYIHRHTMTLNEVKSKIKAGDYLDVDIVKDSVTSQENKGSIEKTAQDNQPQEGAGTNTNQNYRDVLEYHGYFKIKEDEPEVPVIFLIDYLSRKLLKAEVRTSNGRFDGKEVNHFYKYVLIPVPGSAYGIGFGHLLKSFKSMIETLFNQTIDNLTLNNTPWGIMDMDAELLDEGDVEIIPGKFTQVSCGEKPLSQMIYIPRFQQVNPLVMQIIEWIYNMSREVGSVSEVMTGQTSKVEPATAILAKIEQGTKVFSVIMKRVIRQASAEIQGIYELLKMHRKDFDLLLFMPPGFSKIFKKEFKMHLRVDPSNMNRMARLKRAEMVYSIALNDPHIQGDPVKVWWARQNYLESIEDNPDIIRKVNGEAPPPPPQRNIEDKDQVTELADLIRGENMHVLPKQNHLEHIQIMDDFERSMNFDTLDKFRKNSFKQHKRDHQAMLYMIQKADQQVAASARQGG